MHALKLLFLLCLTRLASSIFCSQYDDDTEFEFNFKRANTFFEIFELSLNEKLHQIGLEIAQVDKLAGVYSSILSFPFLVKEQLFTDVMNNSYNNDFISESFLVFFNSTIGLELDEIQREQNKTGYHWIDQFVEKYSSELKDAIALSIKRALDTMDLSEIQRPVARYVPVYSSELASDSDSGSDELDEIYKETESSISCEDQISAKKNSKAITSEEELEEIMKKSSRPSSPDLNPDLAFEANSILYYGIHPSNTLFPSVKAFLKMIQESKMKIFDPQLLFTEKNAKTALKHGFDINNPGFQEFCNYVCLANLPVTSPLYTGPFVSKAKKSEIKRTVLTNLAREKMESIIESMSVDDMVYYIRGQFPEVEHAIIECFVNHVKEEVYSFLLVLKPHVSLVSGVETKIQKSCQHISEIFGLPEQPKLYETIFLAFYSIFQDPLTLVKNYDRIEDWRTYYDENSPTFKPRSVSPEKGPKISGRKSVKIVEDNNEVCLIERIADIEEEISKQKENIPPFRLSATNVAAEKNRTERSSSPLTLFEDKIRVVKNFDKVPSKAASLPKVKNRFSSSEVPDFPFEDSSKVVEYPVYIKSTGDYFFEHGDNSCFMIDERIYTIKEGISSFLAESFEDQQTAESVMKIFENNLNSLFKFSKT